MMNRFVQYIVFLFLAIVISSCSHNEYEEADRDEFEEIPIITTLVAESLPESLMCTMYIFEKPTIATHNNYVLKEVRTLNSAGQNSLKLKNNELIEKGYRFLFIATSSDAKEIELLKSDGTNLQTGDNWEDIMIQSLNPIISADNYQGFVDKTGIEILNGKTINCTLTRLVGQVIFDIYKIIKEGDITISQDVLLPHFTVLDRVFKIEIEYSDMTKSVSYSNDNSIIHQDIWTDTYLQVLEPVLYENNDFKTNISQAVENLTFSEEKQGSAHLKGIYCMPSNENLTIRLTFHYYDTTPLCGLEEVHTGECFETKTIELNLPKSGATPLSIIPNYYTLNTAKIKYDRIIDIGSNFSFEFDTTWKNDNN